MNRVVAVAWAAFAGAVLVAPPSGADDPCAQPICVRGHHYRGNQSGGRCQTEPAFFTRAMSHYLVEGPICPAGWRVNGDNCALIECCYRRACRRDERYRGGYVKRMEAMEADGTIGIQIGAPIEMLRSRDLRRDLVVNTQRITDVVEGMVRQHPEQWHWVMKRWKDHYPEINEKKNV